MISNEFLKKFCAPVTDPRAYLHAPWRDGGIVYATNGFFGVRLEGADVEAVEKTDKHPNFEALFDKTKPTEYVDVPELPPILNCQLCKGSARVSVEECEDCDGDGSFTHGSHEYRCKECDGMGKFNRRGDTHACPECKGLGEAIGKQRERVGSDRAVVDVAYLRVIAQLPDVKIASGESAESAVTFTFTGGRGLVMPMRW